MSQFFLMVMLLGLVPTATNLQETAEAAAIDKLPILLYVSRSDCSFCRRFEEDVLGPLVASGFLADKIVVRELVWDHAPEVRNFDGRMMQPIALAKHYDAQLTPTLLFLDSKGKEIVKRMTGYQRSDYFSFYLERAISEAHEIISGKNTLITRTSGR